MGFDEDLNEEVNKRLLAMEKPGYEFPERMRKHDWFVAAVIALASLGIVEVATFSAGWM